MNTKLNVEKYCNFGDGLKEIEVGGEYQFKEGGLIFNFVLIGLLEDDKYITLYYKSDIENDYITLSKQPFYYSGMVHIMPKNTYIFMKKG